MEATPSHPKNYLTVYFSYYDMIMNALPEYPLFFQVLPIGDMKHEQVVWERIEETTKVEIILYAYMFLESLKKTPPLDNGFIRVK